MVLQNDIDLLNPPAELEKRKHKLKRLVQMSSAKAASISTLRQLWYVVTARQCCANQQVEEPGRALPSLVRGGVVFHERGYSMWRTPFKLKRQDLPYIITKLLHIYAQKASIVYSLDVES
ncbi:40S ribosomal protein [Vigna angularis]|uniref:40S ribosomal protein n=1 Tax=Phaseolus angularis TaxID=3914 RepID=A0A8T0JVK2_PHAAN|nr:40S ribosomal protein [Vigna angularis]